MKPQTLTPKQEAFCLAYIETGNASEAYRRAYNAEKMKPETINVKACELLKNGKVAGRLEAIKARHQKRHDVTVDTLTKELDTVRTLAIADGGKNLSAAVSATMGKARLHGLDVQKQEVTHSGEIRFKMLSDEQLDDRLAAVEAELKRRGPV